MNHRFSSLTLSLFMLFIIILVGIAGFRIIEHYTFLEAFFMTMITISTVGFSELKPLSPTGQLFTIFLIVFSFGVFAYAVTSITRFVVDGGFRNYFVNRRTRRKINRMYDHVIICGFGRNGSEAARALAEKGEQFVIIEEKEDVVTHIRQMYRYLTVHGDASEDSALHKAAIMRAKSLISTLPNDADNLLVVLSARALNPGLQIISRASYEWSDVKMKRAGADNVIMPDLVGGRRMAKLVASPDLVEFLDYMMKKEPGEVQLVELSCKNFACSFLERTIGELKFRKIAGVNIVGMKNKKGKYIFNPAPDMKLESDYKLFVMGTEEQIKRLKAAVFEEI